jgi:hypothetical protein
VAKLPPGTEFPRGFAIPDGYDVELTDERIADGEIGRRFFRWRAQQLRRSHAELLSVPIYHTRVEKVGFLRWGVVAYQNRLVPAKGKKEQ